MQNGEQPSMTTLDSWDCGPIEVAEALKRCLRDCEPLVPYNLYQAFIDCASDLPLVENSSRSQRQVEGQSKKGTSNHYGGHNYGCVEGRRSSTSSNSSSNSSAEGVYDELGDEEVEGGQGRYEREE